MNVESLGRQAIDRIKKEWGLPLHGFVAGGAIANIVWELVSGNKAVYRSPGEKSANRG